MKVLIAGSLASSLLNFRGQLIRDLLRIGAEVHVSAPDIDLDYESRSVLQSWGVVTHTVLLQRTGMNPWADLVALWNYRRVIKDVGPDVFLGYTAKPVIFGLLAARICAVPRRVALITGLGFGFQGGASRAFVRAVIRGLYRSSLRFASVAVFQNPDDQRAFVDLRLLNHRVAREIVNGSGVDLNHFRPMPLPGSSMVFLMIGRLLGDKGVREYVEAARIIGKDFPTTKFILVGPRDSNPDAVSQAEIDQWVSAGVIDYRGEIKDVRPVLAECSVYVLPSYREGTPRSVLEALAIGRPVITTDAPGCRETVEDGVNGFLVPVASSLAVAEAMRRFLIEPDLVARMAEASLLKARTKYDVRLVNQKMLEIMGL